MNTSLLFTVTSLALFAGFFGFGAGAALWFKNRTRILRIALGFLGSLLALSLGFWFLSLPAGALPGRRTAEIVAAAFQILGVASTVLVSPFLVEALIATPMPDPLKKSIFAWDAILVAACALWPIATGLNSVFSNAIVFAVNAQLALTIAGSVLTLALRIEDVKPIATQKAIRSFLLATAIWFALFVADFLVTWLGYSRASFLDNLGLPTYFIALNAGCFVFIVRFLASGPLIVGGKITAECRELYGLTSREVELAERLLDSKSNQEIADELFISKKTVENHLYNMYQKLGAKNRAQFTRTLQDHGRS
jgi:DNA-binding CsgD family transcriptional regulator